MIELGSTTASDVGTLDIGDDLVVNRFGFGAMRITGPGVWGPPADHAGAVAVLRRAIELGVNLIDTADAYGPDISEDLIAEALRPYPEDLVIATKGGLVRSGPGQWSPDGSPAHLREACEGSLRRLGLEQIPLYQFHRVDPAVPLAESLGAIVELKEEGKILHIGLSNVTVAQLEEAQSITSIVSVQNRYNLADRSSEEVLERCNYERIAFLPWAPLAGLDGDLTAAQIAEKHGATLNQVALAWLLHHSPAMLPIAGTSSVDHFDENLAGVAMELSDEDLASLG
jgi:aryl-alcohol dehydrogenase-like predicted oxidoreductase